MKIFYFLLALLFVPNVYGLTNVSNANTTDTFHLQDTSVDTVYQLNSSDSLKKMSLEFSQWSYPISYTYLLKDNENNTLAIDFTYWKINGLLINDVYRDVSVYYNNQPLLLKQKGFGIKTTEGYNITDKDSTTNLISNKDDMINIITFTPDEIWLDSNIFGRIIIITNVKNTYAYLQNPIYVSYIELPESDITKFSNNEINIDYVDNGISKFEYELSKDFNELSFPFQFVFILFKAVLKLVNVLTVGYVISDIDYYQYQSWFIQPLSFLDTLIKYMLAFIKFVWTMGILWTITIVEMIIFIYAYTTSKDILEAFKNFGIYSYNFFNYVLIKPVIWMYEHLLLKVLQLIRG